MSVSVPGVVRNRDCGRVGRGGGVDSGRDRIWDRDRYRSKIGTDNANISVRGMPRIPPG